MAEKPEGKPESKPAAAPAAAPKPAGAGVKDETKTYIMILVGGVLAITVLGALAWYLIVQKFSGSPEDMVADNSKKQELSDAKNSGVFGVTNTEPKADAVNTGEPKKEAAVPATTDSTKTVAATTTQPTATTPTTTAAKPGESAKPASGTSGAVTSTTSTPPATAPTTTTSTAPATSVAKTDTAIAMRVPTSTKRPPVTTTTSAPTTPTTAATTETSKPSTSTAPAPTAATTTALATTSTKPAATSTTTTSATTSTKPAATSTTATTTTPATTSTKPAATSTTPTTTTSATTSTKPAATSTAATPTTSATSSSGTAAEPTKATAKSSDYPPASRMPYSVLVHSFTDDVNNSGLLKASKAAQALNAKGMGAFWTKAMIDGKVWYRVMVGVFSSKKEANAAADDLTKKLSVQANIMHLPYAVELGWQPTREEANAVVNQLARFQYSTYRTMAEKDGQNWVLLRTGAFATKAEAQELLKYLNSDGFKGRVVSR